MNSSIYRSLILPIVGILFIFILLYGQTDVHVKITDSGTEKIRIAVLDFFPKNLVWNPDDRRISEVLTQTVREDLEFSPFFTVMDTAAFPQEQGILDEKDINFINWATAGVHAIVVPVFESKDDRIEAKVQLFSTTYGKRIMKKSYKREREKIHRLAHNISDDIVKKLTGEDGIASTKIAFISKRTGKRELFAIDYDGRSLCQWTKTNAIILSPAWSPTGDAISFTSYAKGNPDLYVLDLTRRKITVLSDFVGLNTSASWSPDGRNIVYTVSKDGNSEIYIMDVRTRRSERLTYENAIDTNPTFSPDGSRIAFTSDRSGKPQIYIMDITGINIRRLTYEGNYNDLASWSPKGDKIAYCSRFDGLFQIAVIDVSGGIPVYLTSLGNNECPSFSPDGYHIAFASDRLGNYKIYTMDADGANIRRITSTGWNYDPAWSPRIEY